MKPLSRFKVAVVAVVLLNLGSVAAHAELPPSVYEQMRAQASDELEIEIVRVARNTRDTEDQRVISIFADAVVTAVKRSKSGVKVGDRVSVRYMTFENIGRGWAGPGPALEVKKGGSYHAWLKKSGSIFYVAARGRSFEEK